MNRKSIGSSLRNFAAAIFNRGSPTEPPPPAEPRGEETPGRLEVSIRKILRLCLEEDGFKGSGRTFRRVVDDWIHVVNVQGSKWGDGFAINLGVHPMGLPNTINEMIDPKKMKEVDCEFRQRLAENATDQWWKHDKSQSSMDKAMNEAAIVYEKVGRPLFERISGTNSIFKGVAVESLRSSDFDIAGFRIGNIRLALALARWHKLHGRPTDSKQFAEWGINNLGPATGLRPHLEAVLQSIG